MSGQNLVVKKFGAKDSLQKFTSNTSLRQVIQGGKILSAMSVDENQKVNVIVELSTPAMLHPKGYAVGNKAAASQQRSIFVNRILSTSSTAKVLRQFSHVMNGVSFNAARSELGQMALSRKSSAFMKIKKYRHFPSLHQ